MMTNRDFDKRFNRTRRLAKGVFIFNALIVIAMLTGIVVLGYNIITDPASVGEFFGKIVNGFNNA